MSPRPTSFLLVVVLCVTPVLVPVAAIGDGCGPGTYCAEAPLYTCMTGAGGGPYCQPYDPNTCPLVHSYYPTVPDWCTENCYPQGQGCSRCPADKVTTVWGVSSSNGCVCPPGQAGGPNTAPCTECPAGSYCPQVGSGAVVATTCAAGRYSNAGQSVCTQCAAGKWSGAGATSCTNCTAGRYSSNPGATTCPQCDNGKYAQGSGASSCLSCPSGGISKSDFSQCTIPMDTPFRMRTTASPTDYPFITQIGYVGNGPSYFRTALGGINDVANQWKYKAGVNGYKVITNVWYSSENTQLTFQDHQIGVNDILPTVKPTLSRDLWEHWDFHALPNGKWLLLSGVNGKRLSALASGFQFGAGLESTTSPPGEREEFEIIVL